MSKEIVIANEKQIVSGISKAINKMDSAKKGYVNSVIELGEILIQAKIKAGHGNWNSFLNRNSELRFGSTEQARKIMLIAENKTIVLEFFNNENSINGLSNAISDATPEQIAQVEQIKKDQADKAALAEATAALAETARILKAAQKDEVIEGVFEEVITPVVEPEIVERPDEDPFEVLQETIDMLSTDNDALQAEVESMAKVFESNEQLTTALAEVKKFQELARVLKESLNGSMNSENAAKRQAKMWKARAEKAEKKLSEISNGT